MPPFIRKGFAAIRPTTRIAYAPDIGRGETRDDARRALHDLLEQKRASPICIIDILPSNTVEEEVVHPDLPCVGRVWHALAHPFFRYLYDEWLEEGGRLIQEVVPLTRGVLFREGILRLAPQELAAIDCEWEWARRNPFSWPPAVAYLADEAGCAAILITRVHDPAQFERLRHATPVRQTTSESPDESAIRVAYVLQSAPLMLEAALGYQGANSKVAFFSDATQQTVWWWDTWNTGTGSWENWCAFLRHPSLRSSRVCRSLSEGDTPEPPPWLVLDRQTRMVYTGTKVHARRYVRQDCIVDSRIHLPTRGEPATLRAALQSWVEAELSRPPVRFPAAAVREQTARHTPTPAPPTPTKTKRKTPRKRRQHSG